MGRRASAAGLGRATSRSIISRPSHARTEVRHGTMSTTKRAFFVGYMFTYWASRTRLWRQRNPPHHIVCKCDATPSAAMCRPKRCQGPEHHHHNSAGEVGDTYDQNSQSVSSALRPCCSGPDDSLERHQTLPRTAASAPGVAFHRQRRVLPHKAKSLVLLSINCKTAGTGEREIPRLS